MKDNKINIDGTFPKRLRLLRREKDWSQGQLANKIDVDPQRISKYERGLSNPPLKTLVQIAHVLEVSLDYLLTGKSYKAEKIKNPRLIKQIEGIEELPTEYQETLISVVESFIKRYKFEKLAQS